MKNQQKVLIIGSVWPEPDSSAAGTRMMQLIQLFKEQNWEIVFASTASDSDYMTNLENVGVLKKSIALNCSSFDDFIKELQPTLVLFDRFMTEEQFGWRVAEHSPEALRMLDTEDLHCLRLARQNAFKAGKDFSHSDLLNEMVAKREIASILRCDLSLIISEFEMEILQTVFKVDSALLHYLPLLVDSFSIENQEANPAFEERNDFVFIGNFLHEPNWNAVQYLNETIWPLIRKALPESNLYIYGAYPPQKALQLHKPKSGFHVLGRAASAKEAISKAKILLAPLRFGAGIKGKLLEAMLYGTPSITTTIGAESMYGNLPWNGFVTNEPLAFADATIQLIQDKNTWMNAQQNGYKIIENRYLKSLHSEHCFSKIEFLSTNLPKHRQENFTGSMLLHHTLNSTKYLSRWIETKNK
jgi:hypothetical protein